MAQYSLYSTVCPVRPFVLPSVSVSLILSLTYTDNIKPKILFNTGRKHCRTFSALSAVIIIVIVNVIVSEEVAARRTEGILGGDWFGQLGRLADSVLVGGRDSEQVLGLIAKVGDVGGQIGRLADLLPRLLLNVALLDHVVRDGAAAVAVGHLPLQIGAVGRYRRYR